MRPIEGVLAYAVYSLPMANLLAAAASIGTGTILAVLATKLSFESYAPLAFFLGMTVSLPGWRKAALRISRGIAASAKPDYRNRGAGSHRYAQAASDTIFLGPLGEAKMATGLKLSPATFIFGREIPPVPADSETSFSAAKISLAGHLGGRDGTADGRHHWAFKIERIDGPVLFGDYLQVFQDNGNDFNLEIGLFGYYEVSWSGLVGVHYFGDLDPRARLHFSRAECMAAERLIRQFFSNPANVLRYSGPARFLGRVNFRPDWIIESSQEFRDFEHWSAQDLVAAKSSTSRPFSRFLGARVGFGGVIFGSDEAMHTLFEVERNAEMAAEEPVLYGEYTAVFPNPDLPNTFNIEIKAFGYTNPVHVGDVELRRRFTADDCADLEFFIRSFFSNPVIFQNGWALSSQLLGVVTFAPGWIKRN